MNCAQNTVTRLGIVCLVFLLSGCIAFEQISGSGNKERRILFQNQYSAYYELQKISQFTKKYEGLSRTQLALLLAEVKDNFKNEPSMLNRYKLVLLLAYKDDESTSTEQITSLIRDGNSQIDPSVRTQSERFLAFLGKQYSGWLQKNIRLNQKTDVLHSKYIKLEKKNQDLKMRLSASEMERDKVKNQLRQLKSIETSIIQRDMNEGIVKP